MGQKLGQSVEKKNEVNKIEWNILGPWSDVFFCLDFFKLNTTCISIVLYSSIIKNRM